MSPLQVDAACMLGHIPGAVAAVQAMYCIDDSQKLHRMVCATAVMEAVSHHCMPVPCAR